MNDLTRYRRIEMPPEPWTHEDDPEWIFVESHPEPYMLVPDSTLQDIADAYKVWLSDDTTRTEAKLYDLLDALTQEDTP